MRLELMGVTTLPTLPMIIAFAIGFIAGLMYRQTRWLSLIIFLVFVAIISGVISISFTVDPA